MTLTYQGHPLVTKRMFVADMVAHREADRIIAGTYGEGSGPDWQGCAVGCGVHTINRLARLDLEDSDHAGLADALGWPEWLTQLTDSIFEGLPFQARAEWPERLARAVPVGADIDSAFTMFRVRLLREVVAPVADVGADVVERVAAGLANNWEGDERAATGAAAEAVAWAAAWDAASAAAWVSISDILVECLSAIPDGPA